jgi:hypothetical protein
MVHLVLRLRGANFRNHWIIKLNILKDVNFGLQVFRE